MSLRNYSACLDYALTLGNRIGILCSGRKKRPSWEDSICAGGIIDELSRRGELLMTDSARIALTLWQNSGNDTESVVRKSNHAQYLTQIGYSDDISFACEIDSSTVVPVIAENEAHTILRSVSGSARPYHRGIVTAKKADPFEELLAYTRKKVL